MPNSDVETVDLLVIGSGAGGLAAAVTAASQDLRVQVVEKEAVFGGTTAWSGGRMWIPGNGLKNPERKDEEIERARAYLRDALGTEYDANQEKIFAYLEHGPRMVAAFQAVSYGEPRVYPLQFEIEPEGELLDFRPSPGTPDLPRFGDWRAIHAKPFDGRTFADQLAELRRPLDVLTLLGMAIDAGAELRRFQHGTRQLGHVARRLAKHFKPRNKDRHLTWLVNGNALVARLLIAAHGLGVTLRARTTVDRLIANENGRVIGARMTCAGRRITVSAERGVVLACGGAPHDIERIRERMPRTLLPHAYASAAPLSNTGDGLRLGESVGGAVRTDLACPAAWVPVSLWRRSDSSRTIAICPHFIDRAKPGVIAVTRRGKRFCNEARAYHDFVSEWLKITPPDEPAAAWLICDRRFLFRYGLGAVQAPPIRVLWSLRSGYLKAARTLEGLARSCGIDATALRATVDAYNEDARKGEDRAFSRGTSEYDRSQGDASYLPNNPCIAPIERAPYFAVRLHPGSIGTFAGLDTDAEGRVRNMDRKPIDGLYACGNDMAAAMGGVYPSSGLTLGAAMTFGYRVGMHAKANTGAPTSPAP